MHIKYELNSPGKSPGLARKLLAFVAALAVIVLVVMFSAVLFVIILMIGAVAWSYLWWKTRALRKQMRSFAAREMTGEDRASNETVIEGEVIRVVERRNAG